MGRGAGLTHVPLGSLHAAAAILKLRSGIWLSAGKNR
jgi:hypothetical protein